MGDVTQAEGDGDAVKVVVREWQCLGVSLDDLSRAVFQVTGYILLSVLSTISTPRVPGPGQLFQRQLEDSHKESNKRFQKLQKDVSHNVEELLRMVAFLESNYRDYVEALEAGQRARVKRLRDEQEENLRLQRAQNEAHIADLERQTQKMMKVSK